MDPPKYRGQEIHALLIAREHKQAFIGLCPALIDCSYINQKQLVFEQHARLFKFLSKRENEKAVDLRHVRGCYFF